MSQSSNRAVLNPNSRPVWAVSRQGVSRALSYSVKCVQGQDREDARADKPAGARSLAAENHIPRREAAFI